MSQRTGLTATTRYNLPLLYTSRETQNSYVKDVGWSLDSKGKRGALRVIYTAHLANGALVVLLIYCKSATENIPAHVLRKIAKELNHAPD